MMMPTIIVMMMMVVMMMMKMRLLMMMVMMMMVMTMMIVLRLMRMLLPMVWGLPIGTGTGNILSLYDRVPPLTPRIQRSSAFQVWAGMNTDFQVSQPGLGLRIRCFSKGGSFPSSS